MILTVTPNPAIDKNYTIKSLLPGQVNRLQSVRSLAGGKGINVTRVLRQYGCQVTAMGFLGGAAGSFIENHIKQIKAVPAFTKIAEETRSNMNLVAKDGCITELLERGPVITEAEWEQFLTDYQRMLPESELIVLSGSLPEGVPTNLYGTLIRLAKEQEKRVILDTSGESLAAGAEEKPFMLKPNQRELEYLLGRPVSNREEAARACLALVGKGIPHVMVSLGEKGLLYAGEGGKQVLYAAAPAVESRNTIGCGDSVVASFCLSYLRGEDGEETIRRAVAISAAGAENPDVAVIPMNRAEELYREITTQYLL